MPARFYREDDIDTSLIRNQQVAVLGYGNQGRAQALILREQGLNVAVFARQDGPSFGRAQRDGFDPRPVETEIDADVVVVTLPDEVIPEVMTEARLAALPDGALVVLAHGFVLRFGLIHPKPSLDVAVVSPKGPGRLLHSRFLAGDGLFGMVAVHQDATGLAMPRALAYGWGIGCARRGILESTIDEEADVDLFGEQVVLCGGIPALFVAAVATLIEAGYTPEAAYIDCVHEIQLIADLLVDKGLEGMRRAISDTAEFGGYLAGDRLVTDKTRAEMRALLAEIRAGKFAEQWMAEAKRGKPTVAERRREESAHPVNQAFRRLRPYLAEANVSDAEP